ncbi:MAG: hypothetical protein WCN95_15720, partial [bacterium]
IRHKTALCYDRSAAHNNEIYYPCNGTVSGNTITLTCALLDGAASISATVSGGTMSASVDFQFTDASQNYSSGYLTWYRG